MANMISIADFFDLLKTKVGWVKPGHKYLYRIQLPSGGYRYYYNVAKTGKTPKKDDEPDYRDFTDEEALEHDKDQDFIKERKEAEAEFMSFANPVLVSQLKEKVKTNVNGVYGPMWEVFAVMKEVKDFHDMMSRTRHLLETYKDPKTQQVLRDFVSRVAAFRESPEDSWRIEEMIKDGNTQWGVLAKISKIITKIEFKYFRLASTAHLQETGRVSDVVVMDVRDDVNNDLGILFINYNAGKLNSLGISQKVFSSNGSIDLKSNGVGTVMTRLIGVAGRLVIAGLTKQGEALKRWSNTMSETFSGEEMREANHLSYKFIGHVKLKARNKELERLGAKKFSKWIKDKAPEAATMSKSDNEIAREYRKNENRIKYDIMTWRSRKLKKDLFNALSDPDFLAGFSEEIFEIYAGAFHDQFVSELLMVMPTFNEKDKTSKVYIALESHIRKELKKLLSPGNFTLSMDQKKSTMLMGKSIENFGNLEITVMYKGKPTLIGDIRVKEHEGKFLTRAEASFILMMMETSNLTPENVEKKLEEMGHTADEQEDTNKSTWLEELFKATQTLERKKMNAKYIRKELTESGKVRYIYKETEPRTKKAEDVPTDNRDKFLSSVDSVDKAYETLFKDAASEIDDEHYLVINAGCVSTRITKDVETLHDVLDVPQQLRDRFADAAGLINSINGKMGFCTSNFPADVSDMVKKAAMMHEMGHAYFYGALRIKHKQPLIADIIDSKNKEQKDSLKKATKFVDSFGKMDDDIRKQAEESVVDVKGQDKDAMLQEAISAYMVSSYAAETSEEHFAEAFSRYFILPEQLKKKEKDVYEHFNEFFGKYDGE